MTNKKRIVSLSVLLAISLCAGGATVSAGDKFDTDPKHQLPRPDGKPADMTKPVQVFILMGQSNMCGMGNVSKLEEVVKGGKYPYLVDDAGKWAERKDVRNINLCNGSLNIPKRPITNGPLTIQVPFVGVDQPIGHILGNIIDAPVLILKSANGNRSLGFDLLPPGSEPYDFEGKMQPPATVEPRKTPRAMARSPRARQRMPAGSTIFASEPRRRYLRTLARTTRGPRNTRSRVSSIGREKTTATQPGRSGMS